MKIYIIRSAILIILSLCIVSKAVAYDDFYKGSKRGWFWFEQSEVVLNEEEHKMSQESNQTATDELNQFREELDEAKAAMIMRPNVDSTIKFIRYQNEMFRKADTVTANWQDALLVEPGLNIAREIPISATGAKIKSRSDAEDNKELLKSFAKKFQLLFFYKGSCIYCSHFAEVLEVFANRYGFAVSSVAMDNKEIKKFPSSNRVDLVEKWGVDFVPSVFAYSQELGVAIPISSSFLAIDELEKHAVYAASKLKERLR